MVKEGKWYEHERRAVYKEIMQPIGLGDSYDLANPEVVDEMMNSYTGAQIVLAIRWKRFVKALIQSIKFKRKGVRVETAKGSNKFKKWRNK